jgi:hypothetical protein
MGLHEMRQANLDDPLVVLSTRIPHSLRLALENYITERGINITDAVRQAIESLVSNEVGRPKGAKK